MATALIEKQNPEKKKKSHVFFSPRDLTRDLKWKTRAPQNYMWHQHTDRPKSSYDISLPYFPCLTPKENILGKLYRRFVRHFNNRTDGTHESRCRHFSFQKDTNSSHGVCVTWLSTFEKNWAREEDLGEDAIGTNGQKEHLTVCQKGTISFSSITLQNPLLTSVWTLLLLFPLYTLLLILHISVIVTSQHLSIVLTNNTYLNYTKT